jgi:predicted enzyme related to lactoylglutathione lyase
MISKLDFVGIPSTDAERSRAFGIWEPGRLGMPFAPQKNAHPALHVDDVAAARAELEAKGVEFFGDILDTGVCHMAFFTDPDGNDLMLHRRYAQYES